MYNNDDDEMIISFSDVTAHLLLKWKILVLGMLIGLLVMGGYGYKKVKQAQAEKAAMLEEQYSLDVTDVNVYLDMDAEELEKNIESYDMEIANAKAALTPFSISYVERLASQYRSYNEYKKKMLEYYLNYMLDTKELKEHLIKKIYYYVQSPVPVTQPFFYSQNLFSQDDYAKMSEISPDEDMLSDIYGRVFVFVEQANSVTNVQLTNDLPEEDLLPDSPTSYILTIMIIASDAEETDQMQLVIEDALARRQKELAEADLKVTIKPVLSHYTDDVMDTVINGQQTYVDSMTRADNAISNLQNNFIQKLTEDEKKYFDLIKEKQEAEGLLADGEEFSAETETDFADETEAVPAAQGTHKSNFRLAALKKISKKYLVLGLVLGLFGSAFLVVLAYVLNGKVKTPDDLSSYRLPQLSGIARRGKSHNLFGGVARSLRGCQPKTAEADEVLLAQDLSILIRQKELNNVFFALPADDKALAEEAQRVQTQLAKKADTAVKVGAPLYSAEELDTFASSDAILLLVRTHVSRQQDVRKLLAVSDRYEKPVLGYVCFEEC